MNSFQGVYVKSTKKDVINGDFIDLITIDLCLLHFVDYGILQATDSWESIQNQLVLNDTWLTIDLGLFSLWYGIKYGICELWKYR